VPGRWRARGSGGAGSGPRRCAAALEARAKLPAAYGETPPATPATYGAALPGPFNASPRVLGALCTAGQSWTAWRAEGVPLIDCEESPHHSWSPGCRLADGSDAVWVLGSEVAGYQEAVGVGDVELAAFDLGGEVGGRRAGCVLPGGRDLLRYGLVRRSPAWWRG
jgi:hypothetical protein